MSKAKNKPVMRKEIESEIEDQKKMNTRSNLNKNKESNSDSDTYSDKYILYLLVLVTGLIPIIIFGKLQTFIMPVIDAYLNFSTTVTADIFTYYKLMALIFLTIIILIIFIIRIFGHNYSFDKPLRLDIPILVFVISLCLSVAFSNYKTPALWGGYTRNFGVMTYLSSVIILFVLINQNVTPKWEKLIIFALYPVVIINFLLIILSFYGFNILDNHLFTSLFAGDTKQYITDTARINGTLNNRNYLSGMGAVLFAIFAGKSVWFENRFSKGNIINIILAVLSGVIVAAANSLSGVVTIVFVSTFLLGLIIIERKGAGTAQFAIIWSLMILAWIILAQQDIKLITDVRDSLGLLLITSLMALVLLAGYYALKNKESIRKYVSKKKLICMGSAVIVICVAGTVAVQPIVEKKVTAEMDRINKDLIIQKLEQNEFDFPEAKFTWGTGRIYLWKETLKLIAQKPFFGYGFDTLPFVFDQTDSAKIAALNDPKVIVDKPHNIYINMIYGAGIVTFLAFASIIAVVIWKSLKALISGTKYDVLIWPLLLGILAYLYQGLFNDPVQGFDVIFWVIMGLAFGLAGKDHLKVQEDKA